MGYVFISYSTKNQSSADAMRHLLTKNGIASWMAPADIPAGSKYAQVINRAIKDCACVVLMLSEASQNSVWVSKEIERAINYRKVIIPVQLESLILNDEFELYISTDQIVAINRIDENAPEIKKVLASVKTLCGSADDAQNDATSPGITQDYAPSGIEYKLSVSAYGGSLFLYSKDSISKKKAKPYTVREGEWKEISQAIVEYIAFLYHTDPDLVVLTLHDSFAGKKCAPLDGYHYYENQFRINFGVSLITSNPSKIYDSAHISVFNELSLCFYNEGSYIYPAIPVDATLSDLGLDEQRAVALSQKLLHVLHPNRRIVTGEKFETRIYSDFSGGYKLHYLVK